MRCSLFLLISMVSLLTAAPGNTRENPRERPPNIVFILSDDLGYPYHGFLGNETIRTPNLDRLAAEGTTFTRAFSTASVCQPALQTLLSGLHPRAWKAQRTRLEETNGRRFLRRVEVGQYTTLPRQLSRKGYRTFQGGKHWEGDFSLAGFDEGTTTVLPDLSFPQDWFRFGRLTLSSLQSFFNGVEEDEPFFLFFAPMLPHHPHDPSPRLFRNYLRKGLVRPAALYYANITRFDFVVGRLLEILEARGLSDNTLIIYVSDNGWEQGPQDLPQLNSDRLGGDRGKLSIYELGFRSPLIFHWPGHVPENEQRDDLVSFEDLHATMLRYAGAPLPPDHEGYPLNERIAGIGEAVRDHVTGFQDILRKREGDIPILPPARFEDAAFLRTERWRYVEWLDRGEQALFEIEADPFERNDVGPEHPELLAQFASRTSAWRDALDEPAPWIDLMGRLMTEDETAVSGLRLWLDGTGSGNRLQVFSDDRGFFRFPNVPADQYTLSYEIEAPAQSNRWKPPTSVPVTQSRPIDLAGYETGPFVTLRIPGRAPPAPPVKRTYGEIEIEISADPSIQTGGRTIELRGWTPNGYVEQRVLSGPDGFVAVDQLPTGFYLVRIEKKDSLLSKSRLIFLGAGANQSLSFALQQKKNRGGQEYQNGWKSKPGQKKNQS